MAQLRRLIESQQKIPKPAVVAPSTGAGIAGMVQVSSTPGSVVMGSGEVAMPYGDVTYDAPLDPYAGSPGASSAAWLTVSDYKLTLAVGWYDLTASFRLGWSSESAAPPGLSTYIQGGWDAAHNDPDRYARAPLGPPGQPLWGVQQVVNHGPTFINSGDAVWFESRCSGGFATADSIDGYLTWNIAKLG